MDTASLPLLDLHDDPRRFADEMGESIRTFGFAMVRNHGIDPGLVARGWALTEEFFALTESEKRRYFVPGIAGARGYTPFGTEIAKGGAFHDLKEFWHVGRDLPPGHPLAKTMPPNVWPDRPDKFRETFQRLFAAFENVGGLLLSRIALHLGLAPDWFAPAVRDGNSVLRLLHYPPVPPEAGDALRAGGHEDINLITLLLGAEEAGLQLLRRDGAWIDVSPPEGAMVVNIGDMLQRLTNHVLPSTTHRVRNPKGARAGHGRYAMPFFHHLRSDFRIETLRQCVTAANPDRYPIPATADECLQERLREIGLRSQGPAPV